MKALWLAVPALLAALAARGEEGVTLPPIQVTASPHNLLGLAGSATQGTVSRQEIEARPILRPAELLESVPGLIVTQHSGDGKANQHFLRGFNLDHGSDLGLWVDGMPVNLPSHAHAQGYADINFLIPELVRTMDFRKGPYAAEDGDFSTVGTAHIRLADRLPSSLAKVEAGPGNFRRALVAGSPETGAGKLLYGFAFMANDGPWDHPQGLQRLNGTLRYSQGTRSDGFSLTAIAFDSRWNATDQVPRRALDSGAIGRYGTLDASDGGRTSRYGVSGQWRSSRENGQWEGSAYAFHYRLQLWSNFTYALNDPVRGDQIEQADRRNVIGGQVRRTWFGKWSGAEVTHRLGLQGRTDFIGEVGLHATEARRRFATTRADRVTESQLSPFYEFTGQWTPWLKTVAGLRQDFYRFRVDGGNPADSGEVNAGIASPKFTVVFGPWADTEYYLNYGRGFHSNDARGTTLAADPVKPLAKARGAEAGVRTAWVPGLQSTLAAWTLENDSELLFVGDSGSTEAGRASLRRGVEWTNRWEGKGGLALDADFAWSRARYASDDGSGVRIPGTIGFTASVAASFREGRDRQPGWFGAARLRHFGPRPLTEDGAVRSGSSTLVNGRLGYRLDRQLALTLDVFNLFDRKVADIDYFYESRMKGEPGPVADIHTHPAEPRTFRLGLRIDW
jgi:outer membrane receptor protein involved in Fe transport